jgi:hypothetical protein
MSILLAGLSLAASATSAVSLARTVRAPHFLPRAYAVFAVSSAIAIAASLSLVPAARPVDTTTEEAP